MKAKKPTWGQQNKERIDSTLKYIEEGWRVPGLTEREQREVVERVKDKARKKRQSEVEPEDLPKPKKRYSALVSFYHPNMGGKLGERLVNGSGLYYVVRSGNDTITLLHNVKLDTVDLPRRAFDEGLTDVWWPFEARTDISGVHCDPLKYADSLERQASSFLTMGKQFSEPVVREAIADLRGVPLEQVAKFKPIKEKREMADYMKRAKALSKQWEESDDDEAPKKSKRRVAADDDEDETPVRKAKTNKSAKAEKESSSMKKNSKKVVESNGKFVPYEGRSKNSPNGIVINFLHKKGSATFEQIDSAMQKAGAADWSRGNHNIEHYRIPSAQKYFAKFGMKLIVKGETVTVR